MNQELIIDSFAGGGGASLGIQWATGRGPDVAVNHDAASWKAFYLSLCRGLHLGAESEAELDCRLNATEIAFATAQIRAQIEMHRIDPEEKAG